MAPSTRARAEHLSVQGKSCRDAAVLAILYPGAAGPSLVLTLRHADLPAHAGQVSFPGGARDPGEELSATALRETEEEIGLDPDQVKILGPLTPLYVPPSGFCIYPFVGAVEELPALRPFEREVSAVLHVPLSHLLSANTRVTEEWVLRGEPVTVPFYRYETHKVWGATAMILAELLEVAR
ncbi:MAG TPA: CoA pyrophosphatase [Rhodothermales bacterium]